jgi:hypothetical protein
MLIDIKPAVAVPQPSGAFGIGAGLQQGDGSAIRQTATACALPRVRRVWPGAAMFSAKGQLAGNGGVAYQMTSQHKYMTRTNPVGTGGVGPYPGREPKPV